MATQLPLTKGYTAIVSDEDADLGNHKWFARTGRSGVYACRDVKHGGKQIRIYLHRCILERILGHSIPEGMLADHISRDTLNNKRSNLRLASPSQNIANSRRMKRTAPKLDSPYRGVYWIPEKQKWRAQITVNKKSIYLGYYTEPETAALAYNEAALKHRPQFARLNKVTA